MPEMGKMMAGWTGDSSVPSPQKMQSQENVVLQQITLSSAVNNLCCAYSQKRHMRHELDDRA